MKNEWWWPMCWKRMNKARSTDDKAHVYRVLKNCEDQMIMRMRLLPVTRLSDLEPDEWWLPGTTMRNYINLVCWKDSDNMYIDVLALEKLS